MAKDRFSNPKYVDWLKDKLSLQYAKEGLENITAQNVQTFHTNLSFRLQAPSSSSATAGPTLCHACLKIDLKKQWSRQRFSCPSGICNGWLELLQQNHVDPTSTVEWDNFDVSQLPISAWECAKVYLPYGSGKVQCAGDADLAAILTLYLNCRPFASSMQDLTLCEKVKDIRNRLLHSGNMEVEHSQMLSDVGVIKQLLIDPAFAADTSCQGAITKIDKLVGDIMELSQNRELELVVLNSDIKAVAYKTDQLRQDMDNLTGKVQQQYGQMKTEVSGVTTEVSSLKDHLRKEVGGVTTDVSSLKDQLRTEVSGVKTEMSRLKDQLKTEVIGVTTDVLRLKDQLRTDVSGVSTDVSSLKYQLRTEVSGVTTDVSSLKDQLRTQVSGVDKEMTNLKDKIEVSMKDIIELHEVAELLCSFINACHIDKADMGQLAVSISTLLNLRSEAGRQAEVLTQLQETVGCHRITLAKHGGTLEQQAGTLEQHAGTLEQHAGTLDQHEGTLEQYGGTLEQHGGTLEQHEGTLEQYGATLEQHGGTLEQHERKLNIIESERKAKSGHRDRENPEMVDVAALQQYLIDLYRDDCVWINPVPLSVQSDESASISQMYVEPAMKLVWQKGQKMKGLNEKGQRQGETMPIPLSYKHIFLTGKEQCKNIYITGNAGMGKTVFCKQLVYTWCKAVQHISEKGDSADDLSLLKEFRLLFYINLREMESQYHIEEMIRDNVLHNAPTAYNVTDLLKTEKCLVVLDGLDEWSCPQGAKICRGLNKEIPGRNTMNKNCVFLTTTRNWKFDVIDLKSTKECDKHGELCGIGDHSSEELAKMTLSKLNPDSHSESPLRDFFTEVQEKNLDSLTRVPILLIHLVTLWYFCKDLGKSQVQLYCRMLDLLLEQAKKHLPENASIVSKPVQTDATLPECFTEEVDSCHNHTELLLCLSKLAFMSLLNKKKEASLVFKSSKLEIYGIDSSDIRLCLKCGILTQTKVVCNSIGRYKKYSFLHKKLQEFLAAVYLVTSNDVDDNMKQVREYCDKLNTTLEMGQMFMFACGMEAEIGNQLLEHLISVVSDDTTMQLCRQSMDENDLIKDIQTHVMTCVEEGIRNGITCNVHLQDWSIDNNTMFYFINHVVEKQFTKIKSVSIDTEFYNQGLVKEHVKENVTVVLKHLQKVNTLEKLWLLDDIHVVSADILALVLTSNVSTLKSLGLINIDLIRQEALFAAVLGCIPSLRALRLGMFRGELDSLVLGSVVHGSLPVGGFFGGRALGSGALGRGVPGGEAMDFRNLGFMFMGMAMATGARMSHGQIEQLLAATLHLTHLHLDLYCIDCLLQCRPEMDLSTHTQLQTLSVWYMCVINLHAVTRSVENVNLLRVTVALSTLRKFMEALAQSSNKVVVQMRDVTVTEDNGDPTDLVAYLRRCGKFTVKDLHICPFYKTWNWVRFLKE